MRLKTLLCGTGTATFGVTSLQKWRIGEVIILFDVGVSSA
jgi:hypothetical protein